MNMKKFYILSSLLALFLSGCDEKEQLRDPGDRFVLDSNETFNDLVQFNNKLLRKNKMDEPVELDYFDWGTEALINYNYRFLEADTVPLEIQIDSFFINVPVVQLDSMDLNLYVEIPEVINFLTEMNSLIQTQMPVGFTPAIIDVERKSIESNPSNAEYKITTLYKKQKATFKLGISPNDPEFLIWDSVCPGGMPASAARILVNKVLDDFYYWNFPSWSTAKINNNGLFFTDICWGNINGSVLPNPSMGKCVDAYSCSPTFFGHSNCGIAPLPKTTCLTLSQINANLNNAKVLAHNFRPTIAHQVVHCNIIDGWNGVNPANIYYFDRVYYGKPVAIAVSLPTMFP